MHLRKRSGRLLKRIWLCHDESTFETADILEEEGKGNPKGTSKADLSTKPKARPAVVRRRTSILAAMRKNQSALTACLAPELLAQIFVHCVPTSFSELNEDLGWISSVSHVCHSWREIAISCPELWTSIIFSRTILVTTMLSRAKEAPLILRANFNSNDLALVKPLILTNLSRLRILEVYASQTVLEGLCMELKAKCCPVLESLSLLNTSTNNDGQGGLWLPEDIFQPTETQTTGIAVVLWQLKLSACAFPWDSAKYLGLTHLELCQINPSQRPNLSSLLTILLITRRLEVLILLEACPEPAECFTVALPSLHTLTIRDAPEKCSGILEHLELSSTTKLTIECPSSSSTQWAFESEVCRRLIPVISFIYTEANYRAVSLKHGNSFGTEFYIRDGCGISMLSIRVEASGTWPLSKIVSMTQALLSAFPMTRVTSLRLEGPALEKQTREDLEKWQAFWKQLTQFKSVRELRIQGKLPVMLLQTLMKYSMNCIGVCMGPFTDHIGADGIGGQLLPRLDRLVLDSLDCGFRHQSTDPTTAECIRSFLWARQQGKAFVKDMRIRNCTNVALQDLAHFNFLADVDWDETGQIVIDADYRVSNLWSFSIGVFSRISRSGVLQDKEDS